jgi:hypothetical protein
MMSLEEAFEKMGPQLEEARRIARLAMGTADGRVGELTEMRRRAGANHESVKAGVTRKFEEVGDGSRPARLVVQGLKYAALIWWCIKSDLSTVLLGPMGIPPWVRQMPVASAFGDEQAWWESLPICSTEMTAPDHDPARRFA